MLSNLIIAACVFISAIQPVLSEPISFPGTGLNFLSRRQDATSGIDPSGIPTQCTTQCQPIVAAVSNATCTNDPVACLCTNALATSFQACLDCAVTNDPTNVPQSLADADIAALNEACSTAGTPITAGGSSSSSSDGAAATQTSGGTVVGTSAGATGSGSTTTAAAGAGAGAGTGTSTGTTSAATTSTTSGAQRLGGSVGGAVFAALLAGASFVLAV